MKTLSLFLTLLLTPVFLGAQSPPPQAAGYTLTFDDEFDGSSIDTSKWIVGWPWGGGMNDTYSADQGLPSNVIVSNGSLDLQVTKDKTPSGAAYGSAVISGLYFQQYGYWEASVKFTAGKAHGLWPAFWLVAQDGSWPPEIDIMEWYGVAPTIDEMTVHYGSANNSVGYQYNLPNLTSGYHILGMLWTSTSITWYVDNIQIFTTTSGVPTKPMRVILNNDTCNICTWDENYVDSTTAFPS